MFVDPDPRTALHIAKALTNYKTLYRRNGAAALPPEIDQILAVMTARAMQGQPGTTFDVLAKAEKAVDMDVEMVSYAQAAKRLGCSVRTVKRRVADKSLRVVRDHGITRIRVSDLDTYISKHTEGAHAC